MRANWRHLRHSEWMAVVGWLGWTLWTLRKSELREVHKWLALNWNSQFQACRTNETERKAQHNSLWLTVARTQKSRQSKRAGKINTKWVGWAIDTSKSSFCRRRRSFRKQPKITSLSVDEANASLGVSGKTYRICNTFRTQEFTPGLGGSWLQKKSSARRKDKIGRTLSHLLALLFCDFFDNSCPFFSVATMHPNSEVVSSPHLFG